MRTLIVAVLLLTSALLAGSPQPPAPQPPAGPPPGASLTFHAAFDGTLDAAFAKGDPALYSARNRKAATAPAKGAPADALALVPGGGRYGDAVRITLAASPIVFYKGERNIAWSPANWSGTVSLWFRLDPDRELAPGYSDPIIITPRAWDDGALFVDFTRDDVPRRFRFAAFADKAVWNPSGREWDDVPVAERPMIEIARPPFAAGRWTHVAWTWEAFNTEGAAGMLRGYLDGALVGSLTGRRQSYTWNPAEVLIALGVQYRGLMDDLAIFDRALGPEEVRALHALPAGVGGLQR